MRRVIAPVFAVILLAAAAPVFAAGKPTVEPVPFPDGIVLPGGVFCDFDVQVYSLLNTERATTFPADEDGNVVQIVTGQLWIEATNLSSSASVILNISGPVRYLYRADGTTESSLLGRSVPVQPGGFTVSTGRVDQITSSDGTSVIASARGGSIDVCALLAEG